MKYEYQLIARIISDPTAYQKHSDIIMPELFEKYSDLFKAYAGLVADGRYPSITKLIEFTPHHSADIKKMVASVDYDVPVEDLVTELEEKNRVLSINDAIIQATSQPTSEGKIKVLTEAIADIYKSERANFETAYEVATRILKNMTEKKKTGIFTGFRFMDFVTGGLQPSDLVIIAAETSQGKTSLALNITENIIEQGERVSFISLEMSNTQLVDRMLSSKAEIPTKEITYLQKEGVAASYKDKGLHVADVSNNNVTHICGLIRTSVIRYGISVAVVDYLQLVSDRTKQSREQEIGHIARTLKNLAKELNINIIALSQLSRPQRGGNHYPTLARLRDSGQVEEAADLVVFVYRPEYYGIKEYEGEPTQGLAEIIIAKGRNTGTGKFQVEFLSDITKFKDYERTDDFRNAAIGAAGTQDMGGDQEEMPF